MVTFSIVDADSQAKIRVVGVGGSGGNAINRMIESGLQGVEFIAINTDEQDLELSQAPHCIQIGREVTKGLGAGANPEIGAEAIEENRDEVAEALAESDMVFVTAGMGGGTGTGAAPTVAEIARDVGALTVGIVSLPFRMEGMPRMRNAEAGIDSLKRAADTVIIIPNQRLLEISSEDTTLTEAFLIADDVLLQATRGISDLITIPGEVNLDFNDVRTVMQAGGDALMGTAEASGEDRAITAAEKALNSPLLDNVSVAGAQGVLVNISASSELKLFEMDKAVNLITDAVGHEANIIWGTVLDDNLGDEMRVTVIATGFNTGSPLKPNANISYSKFTPEPAVSTDIPAFIRKIESEDTEPADTEAEVEEKSEEKSEKTFEKTFEEKSEKKPKIDTISLNDLQYPTFLRRQKQQEG